VWLPKIELSIVNPQQSKDRAIRNKEIAIAPLSRVAWTPHRFMNFWVRLVFPAFAEWQTPFRVNQWRTFFLSTSCLALSSSETLDSAKTQETSPFVEQTTAHLSPRKLTYLMAVAVSIVWNSEARDSITSMLGALPLEPASP
jgi:hypothetical protein